jgi:hypothetical protein
MLSTSGLGPPRAELSRRVLAALREQPTAASALRALRSRHRFRQLSVGRFFEEIDRLADAGYLGSASTSTPPPVRTLYAVRTRRARSARLRAALRVDIALYVTESDRPSGGDQS